MCLFTNHIGLDALLELANSETDMSISNQFLTSINRTGFDKRLFNELRYEDAG